MFSFTNRAKSHPPHSDYYETDDWIEASFLSASRLILMGVQKNKICLFRFADRNKALSVIASYWSGSLVINARHFVEAQRRMTDLIHKDDKIWAWSITSIKRMDDS